MSREPYQREDKKGKTCPMKRLLTVTATLLFTGSFLAACGGGDDDNPAVAGGDETTTTTSVSATTGGGAASNGELTLTASNFKFDPSTMVANAGKITITLKNTAENTEHNLTIEDLKVDKDVEAGETETIDVENATPGTYAFHCEYHPNTMLGTLTVN